MKTKLLFLLCFLFQIVYAQDEDTKQKNEDPVFYSLKKALKNPLKVKKLNLSNTGLSEFPSGIFQMKELKWLILDSNKIKDIPPQINELEKLQVLSLCSNQIQTIPPTIGDFNELYYLYLDDNKITDLPAEFFKLDKLVVLCLNNNKISKFSPDFGRLKKLEILSFYRNEIEEIPVEIGHLYNLSKLSFSKNHIKNLPNTFYGLTNLTLLFLSGNNLSNLDTLIVKLNKLETLALDSNKFRKLPVEIGQLYNLQKLYLENNELENLLPEIGNLINLKLLNVGGNPMRNLPVNLNHLNKLENLYVKNLKFSSFPQVLYDLNNKGVNIYGLTTKELYQAKLLLSQARNRKLTNNYAEAVAKYNELIMADTNNVQAMSELASLYLENRDYEKAEVISRRALTKDAPSELLDEIRTIHSNSFNKTGKFNNIIEEYELKIKNNPDSAEPYFNSGKYYYDQKKYKLASKAFQDALKVNPKHANSHFYLAIISLINKQDELFILSALQYVYLKPGTKKTKTILPFLFTKMYMKTGVENKKGGTSYFDDYIIRDENNEIIYKSKSPTADLLLAMMMDLSKSGILKSDSSKEDTIANKAVKKIFHSDENNVEIFMSELIKTSDTIPQKLKDDDKILYSYYLSFYKDLIKNGHLETFAYIINNIRREEKYITEWLNNNTAKVNDFYKWSLNYNWKRE